MAKLPEFLRVVSIEHKGESLSLEVRIQLTPEEIRALASAVLEEINRQLRTTTGTGLMRVTYKGKVTPIIHLEGVEP